MSLQFLQFEWIIVHPPKEDEDLNVLANERLFMIEMSSRQFEKWPLRCAAVIDNGTPGEVYVPMLGTLLRRPPRDATLAATELQRKVPGLVLTEVRPWTDLWWS
jgi:hypothetical protein